MRDDDILPIRGRSGEVLASVFFNLSDLVVFVKQRFLVKFIEFIQAFEFLFLFFLGNLTSRRPRPRDPHRRRLLLRRMALGIFDSGRMISVIFTISSWMIGIGLADLAMSDVLLDKGNHAGWGHGLVPDVEIP